VLINLVNNAIKFTDSGEIIITISLDSMAKKHAKLLFSVQDTGIGMSEDQRQRLFQPFSQADSSTTRKYGGTGLGLTICKRLVEMMKGKLQVISDPGEGSTFSFTAKFQLDSEQQSSYLTDDITRGKRIIVIDDNETFRNILFYLLSNVNIHVDFFPDAAKFMQFFENEIQKEDHPQIDLILMDYHLPEINGLDAAIQIKELCSENRSPVILMDTLYGREDTNHEIANQTIDDVIIKPFAPSVLYKCLKSYFQPLDSPETSDRATDEKDNGFQTNLQGINILLAEDNLINQQVAYELLSMEGINVTIVDNGKKAVQHIEERIDTPSSLYDAILMDIQMPVMDGYESTQKINQLFADQNKKRTFPIIAMTAHAMSGDRERCIQAGMDDYVSKPIQPDQIFSVLSKQVCQKESNVSCHSFPIKNKPLLDPIETALKQVKYLDLKDGINRLSGHIKLYNSILQEFCVTHRDYPELIENAIQEESFIRVHELAHTIKGVAGNLSANELLNVAGKIEKFSKQKDKSSCLNCMEEMVNSFEHIIDDAQVLKKILQKTEINTIPLKKELPDLNIKDKKQIKSILIKLLDYLNNNDLSANNVFHELNELVENKNTQIPLDDLLFSIERLDFGHAKNIVQHIAKTLNIHLEA
jgi:CheY-like chemotaxis protein